MKKISLLKINDDLINIIKKDMIKKGIWKVMLGFDVGEKFVAISGDSHVTLVTSSSSSMLCSTF